MKKIIIFGTGKGSSIITDYFFEDIKQHVEAFCVDKNYLNDREHLGLPIYTPEEIINHCPPEKFDFFLPFGFEKMNDKRAEKFAKIKSLGYDFAKLIHPDAFVSKSASIGENSVIFPGCVISNQVRIGANVVIWSLSHVGDRTSISDHCWLSASVCINGDSNIGKNCFLGSNSTVINDIKLGEYTFIGSHSLIAEDTPPNSTYADTSTKSCNIDSKRFMAIL